MKRVLALLLITPLMAIPAAAAPDAAKRPEWCMIIPILCDK